MPTMLLRLFCSTSFVVILLGTGIHSKRATNYQSCLPTQDTVKRMFSWYYVLRQYRNNLGRSSTFFLTLDYFACRLARCTSIITGEEGALPRCKPFKYTYEKEIVMYAYFKKLDYFSTECKSLQLFLSEKQVKTFIFSLVYLLKMCICI